MDETERTEQQRVDEDDNDEQDGDDDDSYANAYLDDDTGGDEDDDELAEMLAKVKTIQQAEGLTPSANVAPALAATPQDSSSKDTRGKSPRLDVPIIQAATRISIGVPGHSEGHSNGSTPKTLTSRSKSPSAATVTKSGDGIKTISRRPLGSGAGVGPAMRVDALLNVKKPAIYTDKLLQAATSTELLEKLKIQAIVVAPGDHAV